MQNGIQGYDLVLNTLATEKNKEQKREKEERENEKGEERRNKEKQVEQCGRIEWL